MQSIPMPQEDAYDASRVEILESIPIRNFHMVEPWLYRGGQPGADGFEALSKLGIKTVVCLRWGAKTVKAERAAVQSLGMNFISIQLNYWSLPTAAVVRDFLNLLDETHNHPIFLHCLHGSDRTGLLIAIFRIRRQQWTVHDAYKEMKRYGFHRFRVRIFKWWLWEYWRQMRDR